MIKKLFFCLLILTTAMANAKTVVVKNIEELKKANKDATPGDIIVLQNGEWNNVTISLNCNGSKEQPITFKAETPGKVIITGNSKLLIGGTYIVVDGLYFTRGFAGDDAIIKFRVNKEQLANNCRVTNTVINDFNNPKRMDDNYWIMLYGKNNRLDHCSFQNKKNMGVLLAVILDDERSRENFHSIDHNYFGFRLPLASNTGEMVRVGVSQHCEFNSNTQITDNFFENCDGETEIISIKSGSNYIRNNLFKECQGSVVLRHGDYNTVENNIFLGNGKDGTGGVRVINKGQWVVNNLFYKCRGEWFRSPLSIMNGVPNSPANRYVEVTEAVIANNSFVDCAPIGLGIGSDTERSVPPKNVQFLNNVFYNNSDNIIYNAYDNIGGISFSGNLVSSRINQTTAPGFIKSQLSVVKNSVVSIPVTKKTEKNRSFDSLNLIGKTRLKSPISENPGFSDSKRFLQVETNAKDNCGAGWFKGLKTTGKQESIAVNCGNVESIAALLAKPDDSKLTINLTASSFNFTEPITINRDVVFTSSQKNAIKLSGPGIDFLFQLKAGRSLTVKNISLDLSGVQNFITTDTSGSSNHSNIVFTNANFKNINGTFFTAAMSSVADSIVVFNCSFENSKGSLFNFTNETTNKGLYNVEKLKISNNKFLNCNGQILNMLRGGNDESTMGPWVIFSKNVLTNCNSGEDEALIHLLGTQRSVFEKNVFTNCNTGNITVQYEDLVYAVHRSEKNVFIKSGNIKPNKFVISKKNVVR